MTLEQKDLLQINATVIAGILILFTLAFSVGVTKAERFFFTLLPLVMLIPFALSSVFAIWDEVKRSSFYTGLGFVYIIGYLIALTTIYIVDIYYPFLHSSNEPSSNTNQTKQIGPTGIPMNISKYI